MYLKGSISSALLLPKITVCAVSPWTLSTHSLVRAEGRGTTASHPTLHCLSLLWAGPQAAPALWAMLWPLCLISHCPLPFSLWCSPPYPEECCAAHTNVGCAHLPTKSICPLAICLHHLNPSGLLFMWGSHSLFPKPSHVSRSPQGWLFHLITS